MKIVVALLLSWMTTIAYADDEQYYPTHNSNTFVITITPMDFEYIKEACRADDLPATHFVNGCAVWSDDRRTCSIIVPKVTGGIAKCVGYDEEPYECSAVIVEYPEPNIVTSELQEVWGHELLHCARGYFHEEVQEEDGQK